MQGRSTAQMGFGDDLISGRVPRDHWLLRLNELVDWSVFEPILGSLYGPVGRPSHPPVVLFKMLLLEQWFNLSDPQCEAQCRDRLSFMRFLGLSLTDPVPDETVLVRFRQRLLERGVQVMLFARLDEQLQARGLIIKRGTLIDATIVQSARQAPPTGGGGSADPEAGWVTREGKGVTHGYKAHLAVDQDSDLIRAIVATAGNVHDSQVAEELTTGVTRAVYADKAYDDTRRRRALKRRGIAPRILHKGLRNRPLSPFQHTINRRWSRVRANVERVFADWKQRRSLSRCRYLGLVKNQLHFTLLALAHNMRRMTILCT